MKKIKCLFAIFIISFSMVGCGYKVVKEDNGTNMYDKNFEYIQEGDKIAEIRDIKTGVHYYIRNVMYKGGLSPVYNSDGTVKVTK